MDYRATFSDGSRADTLSHHGTKGMKWYHRRWQNEDGSLTPEGRIHYQKLARNKPDFSKVAGTIGASVGVGNLHGGIVGAVAGGLAGAGVGYATYRFQKSRYDNANKKLKEDSERRVKEYENSDEYKTYLSGLQKQGSKLNNGGAKAFQSEKNKEALASFKEARIHESEWAKERGLNSPERCRDYIKTALKNFNEHDPDQVVYQHMSEAETMLEKGFISKGTFAKLYDAQLAEDSLDYLNSNNRDFLDKWHNLGSSSESPKKSNKLVEQAIDDAVEVLSGNMSKEEYNRKYAGTGFKMTGSEKPKSGKARYTRAEPPKSSGRYKTGSKSRPETASRGTALDILSSDKKNWRMVNSKNGEREFQYIGAGKGSEAQVKSLRNAGYTYREIEQVLGISSSKIAEILA